MGQEYRIEYDETGDVIDPAFWIDNNNVFAGEFNGYLDRDNLPSATIAAAEVIALSFNNVNHGTNTGTTDTVWVPDRTNTDWQGGEGNAATGIWNHAWTATQDAHYDVHWSGAWDWGSYLVAYSMVEVVGDVTDAALYPGTRLVTTNTVDTIQLRMSVDGVVIATAGPFEDGQLQWATYMVGAIQLPAGAHTLKVECAMFRRTWQTGAADGICTCGVTFRSRSGSILERDR